MKIDKLYKDLTEKQARRLKMRLSGMKIMDIAEAEGVYMRAICSSLEYSYKKIKKNIINR